MVIFLRRNGTRRCLGRRSVFVLVALVLRPSWAMSDPEPADRCRNDGAVRVARESVYAAVDDLNRIPNAEKAVDLLASAGCDPAEIPLYRGLLKALRAEDTIWPAKKLRLANEALADLDDCQKASPNHYETRMLRATVLNGLPGFFGRKDEALRELHALEAEFELKTAEDPKYLRMRWLEYFIDNHLTRDEIASRRLFVELGGKLDDLDS